jgi:uncharacterized pyridoxal phosphate-dependent enzyme
MTTPFRRRTFFKWAAAAPLFAIMAGRSARERLAAATIGAPLPNVYGRLGVRPFINGRGTWTYLSGSLELPAVRQAMDAAARQFVDMFELQRAAGKRLAELSGAESGMITSGSAGAMAAATAACMAGTDPVKIWQLPDTSGMKNEVVMLGGRSAFDSAIRLAGAKLVIAQKIEHLRPAINASTAMVYTGWRDEIRLKQVLAITRPAGVPLMVDEADGIPPIENLSRLAEIGVDLYCFSGGKALSGPQCSGLLLGRKHLIEAALANYSPWEGAVCRSMKVGKEEIVGLLTAVEEWKKIDFKALNEQWNKRAERIAKLVETVPGVKATIEIPEDGNSFPTVTVKWDEARLGLSVSQCDQQLRAGDPRIEVLTNSNPSMVSAVEEGDPKQTREPEPNILQIVSMTLQDGEELIVGRRLRQILNDARKKAAA